jgi:hypothetical protein
MPANDLIVYGVWKTAFTGIAHSVSFGSRGGETVDLGSIEYGGTISASALGRGGSGRNDDKPMTRTSSAVGSSLRAVP